jgi:glycosyltransferase involved in cell wall biosynthesis
MGAAAPRLHFWSDRDLRDLESWDPDMDPDRFRTGYGHTFLELFVRLRGAGFPVTIGPKAPPSASSLVASLEELTNWLPFCEPSLVRGLARDALRCRASVVVIRGDVHPSIRPPGVTTLEIVATPQAVRDAASQRYLPLLPQRGLSPRDPARGSRVRTMVLKAYRKNIPDWLTDDFSARAAAAGVAVRVDTEEPGSVSWADFSDVDVALCSQPLDTLGDQARKPPTKLINAWCAGAIPLVVPLLPYAAIGTEGENFLAAPTEEQALSLLGALAGDSTLAAKLFAGSRAAGQDYGVGRLLQSWWTGLLSAPAVTRRRASAVLVVEYLRAIQRKVTRASLHVEEREFGEVSRIVIVTPNVPFDAIPHAGGRYLQTLHLTLKALGSEPWFLAPSIFNEGSLLAPGHPERLTLTSLGDSRDALARARRRLIRTIRDLIWARDPTAPDFSQLPLGLNDSLGLLRGADVIDLQWPEYGHLVGLCRTLNPRARIVCTLHDVLSQRLSREYDTAPSPIGAKRLRKSRELERGVMNTADVVVVFSRKDADLLPPGSAELKVVDPPLAHTAMTINRHIDARRPLVTFVGLMSRPENCEAVQWFLEHVWERVRDRTPTARFQVVGSGAAEPHVTAWQARPGVDITGYVDDLHGIYSRSSACVIPLLHGAGVKFKAVEAIVAGVPTVSTPVGAEGIDPSLFAAVTLDPNHFADALSAVLSDPATAERQAQTARAQAADQYGARRFTEAVRRIYCSGRGDGGSYSDGPR